MDLNRFPDRVDMEFDACADARYVCDSSFSIYGTGDTGEAPENKGKERTVGSERKMFELYGVRKDGMVYNSPPPRSKEVDILEVRMDER